MDVCLSLPRLFPRPAGTSQEVVRVCLYQLTSYPRFGALTLNSSSSCSKRKKKKGKRVLTPGKTTSSLLWTHVFVARGVAPGALDSLPLRQIFERIIFRENFHICCCRAKWVLIYIRLLIRGGQYMPTKLERCDLPKYPGI